MIYPRTLAQFESHYALAESMERLRSAMANSGVDADVEPKFVWLCRSNNSRRRRGGNIEFTGEFRTFQGRVYLGGEFAVSRIERAFWSFCFVGACVAIVVTSVLAWLEMIPAESIFGSIGGFVLISIVVGLTRLTAPSEIDFLSTLIRRALA
jgi:hypothetical protein